MCQAGVSLGELLLWLLATIALGFVGGPRMGATLHSPKSDRIEAFYPVKLFLGTEDLQNRKVA